MSPPSSRAQARRQRSLVISVVAVLVVALGSLAGVVAGNWSPKLGLDLAGGLSVVYQPAHKVSNSELNETATILGDRIDGLGVSGGQVNTQQGNVVVSVPGVKDPEKLLHEIGTTGQLFFRPGLCNAPAYTPATPVKSTTTTTTGKGASGTAKGKGGSGKKDKSKKAIRRTALHQDSVLASGSTTTTTAATTVPASTTTSTTTVPASTTTSTTTNAGATTTSTLAPASTTTTTVAPTTTTTTTPLIPPTTPLGASTCPTNTQLITTNLTSTSTSGAGVNYDDVPIATGLSDYPSTSPTSDNKSDYVLEPILGVSGERLLMGPADIVGTAVHSANAQLTSTGEWVVNLSFNDNGTQWDKMAQTYFHEIIGIELDGVVQSDPITLPNARAFTSFNNSVQISGNFTQQSAQQLSLALQYGALPVKLNQEDVDSVTPTLGHSALVAGLGAGLVGLLLVLLYTIFYYRLLGVVVLSGLALTGALLYAIISALGRTAVSPSFDLAGVTGIIVSIGITVDSYIVYFERLKDETRSGRTVRTSVDRGFQSAWRTVVAADTVSLVAAVVLFVVAIGDVKGFAFFLGLSTLMDIFMTYFFTRPLVIILGRNERLAAFKRFGISRGLAVETGGEA